CGGGSRRGGEKSPAGQIGSASGRIVCHGASVSRERVEATRWDGSNRTAEGKRRSYSKNKICEPARAWMRRPRGRSGRGLAALGADDGDERHALARGAAQVVRQRELPAPRHAGDLALAGLAAQLQPRLEQHAQARGPDRVAEGLEP